MFRVASCLGETDRVHALGHVGVQYRPPGHQASRAAALKQAEVQRRRQERGRQLQKASAQTPHQTRQQERRARAIEAGMPSEEGLAQTGLSMGVDTTGIGSAIEADCSDMAEMVAKSFHLDNVDDEKRGDDEDADAEYEKTSVAAEEEDDDEEVNEEDAGSSKALVDAAREAVNKENEEEEEEEGPAPLHAPPDPDTLLARLNTRRLYRRAKHYRAHPETYAANGVVAIPPNKTVNEIASDEWFELLNWQQKRNDCVVMKYKKEKKGEAIDEEELSRLSAIISVPRLPTKYELLKFAAIDRAVAVLASYPRSGNSLCRTLFERTCLHVTGSDMRGGLVEHDLVGEAAVSSGRVQYVKTHYPERRGAPQFLARRVVLLVRNPFDAILSYWNLMVTNTHTTTAEFTDEQKELAKNQFAAVARKEIQVWKDFHEYWLSQDIDLLLVRYEDLIREPAKVVRRIMAFTLSVKNMASFFGPRIDRVIKEEELEKLGSYKPRSGGIGKSLKNYPPELFQEMSSGLLSILERVGYSADFVVPDATLWAKIEPIPGYAQQWDGTPPADGETERTIVINGGPLCRTPELDTDWRSVKQSLGLVKKDAQCDCAKCRRVKRRRGERENR